MDMVEQWNPVVGYEAMYEVSSHGRVRNKRSGKIKVATRDKRDGHMFMLLWRNNRQKLMRVNRLVLFAFRGAPQDGQEGCHNDGNPANNSLNNLRWDTYAANQNDRVKHGTSNRGERCGTSKLTSVQVRAIRVDTRLQRDIAAEYGVKPPQISRIKNGKRWAHL